MRQYTKTGSFMQCPCQCRPWKMPERGRVHRSTQQALWLYNGPRHRCRCIDENWERRIGVFTVRWRFEYSNLIDYETANRALRNHKNNEIIQWAMIYDSCGGNEWGPIFIAEYKIQPFGNKRCQIIWRLLEERLKSLGVPPTSKNKGSSAMISVFFAKIMLCLWWGNDEEMDVINHNGVRSGEYLMKGISLYSLTAIPNICTHFATVH